MLKRHLYLLLSMTCLLLAVALERIFFGEANTELFIEHVKERLSQASDEADDQIFQIKERLKEGENIAFHRMLEDSKYPTFIYRNKKMLFWSDHTHSIEYYDLIGYYDERCIETDKEKSLYLTKKSFLKLRNQDYEIAVLIPLRKRYQVENNFLQPTLNPEIFPSQRVRIVRGRGGGADIQNKYDVYLFSVFFPDDFSYHSDKRWLVLLVAIGSLALFFLQLYLYLVRMIALGMAGRATLLLAFVLLSIRGFMIYYRIPYTYVPFTLFEPTTFASSFISPSLGDLFLNILSLMILGMFAFLNYPRLIRYRRILPLNDLGKTILASFSVFTSYLSIYAIYYAMENIFSNSAYSNNSVFPDITQDIEFSAPKVVSLGIFVLVSSLYFFIGHISARLLIKLSDSIYDAPIRFVAGSLIYYLVTLVFGIDEIVLFNLNAVYLIFITFLTLPLQLRRADYSTYIYLFAWAMVSASVGAYSIYKAHDFRALENKQKFIEKLVLENDEIAEYYMQKLADVVKEEPNIVKLLSDKNAEQVVENLRKFHIKRYLDKYQIEITAYDQMGNALNGKKSLQSEYAYYSREKFATEFSNLFFINEVATGNKIYALFAPISKDGVSQGHLLMRFKMRRLIPNSIHRNFFVWKNHQPNDARNQYSYAIYAKNQLIYSYGDFAYDDQFLQRFRHPDGFYTEELETEGFHHLQAPNNENQNIIVTSPKYPWGQVLSNFSFMFLLLVFVLMLALTVYNLYLRKDDNRLSFNAKIQIYLNFAFFLPLIVVSIIIVSILNNANMQETKYFYLEQAQHISRDLGGKLEEFLAGNITEQELKSKVAEVANLSESDINLFSKSGRLLISSQDYIYDNELLFNYINPRAYSQIVEFNQHKVMQDETMGDFGFSVAYVSIKSLERNEVLGVLAIPFLGSKYQYEQQIIDVLSKIIQAFALMLISLLGLSYLSARTLTAPLRLIRQKLRKVSLEQSNEPLEYHSDDEIGLLVSEYNKMLIKLEASKEALSRSEKESAWREMAKQVAHEIKNPLTPMKLHLQQLQRVVPSENEATHKSIRSLLTQVDTLSDIATSFAAFARMPSPKEEEIALLEIVKESVTLHEGKAEEVQLHVAPHLRDQVIGDPKLLSRIFSNLIINGLQAIPLSRVPQVHIYVSNKGEKVLLEFRDNGTGIPDEIQPKVFLPNFTTKSSGSGIGLAIAKRGIEQLGGRIWFETEANVGTSFYIEMPLIKL